jgi:hypothetical protein
MLIAAPSLCGKAMNDFIRSRSHTRAITDNLLASDLGDIARPKISLSGTVADLLSR